MASNVRISSGIEVLVVFFDVARVVLGRFPLVHGVEVDAVIIGLSGLEENSESILKTMSCQPPATQPT